MKTGGRPAVGGVFISYRHSETAAEAVALYRELVQSFGPDQVFIDNRRIKPGSALPETIRQHLASCDALLALIGREWVHLPDRHGRRRLEDPNDYVRVEIATTLERKVLVIPVLVQGAPMPTAEELPDDLVPLVDRVALALSAIADPHWDYDVERLREVLAPVLSRPNGDGGASKRLVVPRELPRPIADFTGRNRELVLLKGLLGVDDAASAKTGRPVVISAIEGMGGVGKSALALQVGHELAEAGAFPDGQLYVNLQGASGLAPLDPLEALGRMLMALGVEPAQIPADTEEAAARFRSLVAGRRLLVLLDNAGGPEDVRPLLPASPTCAVLVTSRHFLATLEGVRSLHLDVLPHDQALELLGRITGPERVAADPEAAAEVVRLCGYLPLAIRIAGARLAARPGWAVGVLATRLADATRRLEELELGELAVRASFDVSLEALAQSSDPLDRAAANVFGLLSLPDGPDLSVMTAAKLLDKPESTVQRLLERLADIRMLETLQPDRYRFHDLVRLYARQRTETLHPESERLDALTRLFAFYTAAAWETLTRLRPNDRRAATADPRWIGDPVRFFDASAALAWLEVERANLVAAISQAAAYVPAIPPELACQLTRALFGFFVEHTTYWQDGVQANQTVLELARRVNDRAAQAHTHTDLGAFFWRLGQHAEAIASQQESLAIWRELGDRRGEAETLRDLGETLLALGQCRQAEAAWQEALAICEAMQFPEARAIRDRLAALSPEAAESPGTE